MEQLLVLLPGPLRLLDGGVQPLEPPGLALLSTLPVKEGRDPRPLVLAVLHHGGLEDLILGVLPHPALDHDARHLGRWGLESLGHKNTKTYIIISS